MEFLPFTVALLALFVTCYGYTCPDSGATFYHADVSTGCQVYHLCEGTQMKTLTCPIGKAFDHHTQRCDDASIVHCTDLEHHHHKRSVEFVHSVSKQELKKSAKEVLNSIQSIARKTIQEVAPSMYDEFQKDYAPVLKSIKNEFEPYFKSHILPRIGKFESYAKQMGGKIFNKIYHSYELTNSTHINVVSFVDIIEEITNDLQPYLKLGKFFAARLTKDRRMKRDTGMESVHTVSIKELKMSTKEALVSIESIVRTALQEVAPTMYHKFQTDYVPLIRSVKSEFEPFIKNQVLPRIGKFEVYAKRMGSKIFEKINHSYELSNSTHINVVSFADIFEEISNDLQPFLKLGRYFSSRLTKNTRTKRETGTPITDVPELLLGYLEPALKDIFSSATSMFSGNDNTLLSKVIMPVLLEIKNDEESMLDVKKIFWSSKAAFSPLMYDMLNRQSFDDPEGTIIRVPRSKIAEAKAYFYRETKPLITKLFTKHLPSLLSKLSENTKLIFSTIERMKLLKSEGNAAVLRDDIMRFIRKHSSLWKSESGSHVSSYTITEIKKDLKPIEIGVVKFILDYVDQMEDSWLKILFGRSSFLTQTLLGGSETYAVPSGNHQTPVAAPSRNVASPSRIQPVTSQLSPERSNQNVAVPRGLPSNTPTRNLNVPFVPARDTQQYYPRPSASRNVPSRTVSNSARRGSPSVAGVSNYWHERYRQALQGR